MISVMLQGTLKGEAVARMGKVPFVTATVRTPTDGEAIFAHVIAFDEQVTAALQSLHAGEPVVIAGTASLDVWVPEDGAPRPQLRVIATAVMTLAAARRKRREPMPDRPPATTAAPQRGRRGFL